MAQSRNQNTNDDDNEQLASILDEPKSSGRRNNSGGGGNSGSGKPDLKIIVGQLIFSIIISLIVVYTLAASKSSFNDLSTKVQGDTDKAITALQTKQAASETTLTAKITAAQTAVDTKSAAADSRVNSIDSKVNTFESRITALTGLAGLDAIVNAKLATFDARLSALGDNTAKITEANAKITALTTRITDLETKVSSGGGGGSSSGSGTVTKGSVTATLKPYGDIILGATEIASSLNNMVKLTLVNTSNVEVEDIMITMSFEAERYMTSANNTILNPLAGYALTGGTSWTPLFGNPTGFAFTTPAPGIKLKANETKKWYLTLKADYSTGPAWEVAFDPIVEIDY